MKTKHLLIVMIGLLGLSACHKEKNTIPAGGLIGKWQVTKLTLHQVTSASTPAHDTTFNSDAFTVSDFYLFNRDNTALVSYSGVYTFSGKTTTIDGGTILVSTNHFKYSLSDDKLMLTLTDFLPQALLGNATFSATNTINLLDATHLVLNATYYYPGTPQGSGTLGISQTTYFTKTNLGGLQ